MIVSIKLETAEFDPTGLLAVNWIDVGGWSMFVGLTIAVLFLVLRGHLVPRYVVKVYQDALEKERASSNLKDQTIAELMQGQHTGLKVMQAIQGHAGHNEDGVP